MGVKYFQLNFINWSIRSLGKVHRVQICMPTNRRDFDISQKTPQAILAKPPISPVVQSASFTVPRFGKGVDQLPKNSTVPSTLTKSIMAYSDNIMEAQRNPEYSVWYPLTSSDSAMGRSNGARFDSASEAMKKIIQAMNNKGIRKMFQAKNPPAAETDSPQLRTPKK